MRTANVSSDGRTTYFFAGGGSGGHLYPGLAIAERIRAYDREARCVFLCSEKRLDAQILSAEGERFVPIGGKPLTLRPGGLVRFVRAWPGAVRSAGAQLDEAQRMGRTVVIALGGYIAAPVVRAARRRGIGVVLANLDAVPGKANRWIARSATVALTAADGRSPRSWKRIAPIVRSRAVSSESAEACRAKLGLDPSLRTLFVTGGSQGARSINELMMAMCDRRPELFEVWQVLHQCGAGGAEACRAAYERSGVRAVCVEFIDAMGEAWGAADLSLTRCGAGAVAEVWANRVPSVFLPYPYHRDDHQRLNAEPLVSAGGALLATDHLEAAANLAEAGVMLGELLEEPVRLDGMRVALERLGPADGADSAARAAIELAMRG